MTYEEALRAIHRLEGRPWRSGLDRMRAFVDRAGLAPCLTERNYVHVAGTNGKGTTTAFVESILRAQGLRTGAFFSPYVVDYRERIQAEGRQIDPNELVALVERLLPVADAMTETPYGGATKFELETAMGLAYWDGKGSQWVALEVGLGGRLDATNVVTPRACAIVSVGLDHMAILGDSLPQIAAEKAGIVKPGVPVVVGRMQPKALNVIRDVAAQRASPFWQVDLEVRFTASGSELTVETPVGTFRGERPSLGGVSGAHNAAVAVAACAAAGVLPHSADLGHALSRAWLPGRSDWRTVDDRRVLFDGAHNAAAAEVLAQSLRGRPLRLVSNMIAGHETSGFYEAFLPELVAVEIAPIDSPRARSVAESVADIEALGVTARGHGSVQDALRAALEHEEQVVVTGSNYLVGEALRLFGR